MDDAWLDGMMHAWIHGCMVRRQDEWMDGLATILQDKIVCDKYTHEKQESMYLVQSFLLS